MFYDNRWRIAAFVLFIIMLISALTATAVYSGGSSAHARAGEVGGFTAGALPCSAGENTFYGANYSTTVATSGTVTATSGTGAATCTGKTVGIALSAGGAAIPSVSARAAVLYIPETGDFIYEKRADDVLPMASTTKIMTALVAAERLTPDEKIEIDARAVGIEGSSLYLTAGDSYTAKELIEGMLLASANDAAAALAIAVAGDIPAFAEMMNGRAREIGLSATHFENPHGLDGESHRTTARELALISAEAMENDLLRGIFREKSAVIGEGEGRRTLTNHNKMLRLYDGCTGVKTGFTKKSGRCLVTAAERDGLTLIGVTLSAPDDWDDHTKMLDYGFSLYEKRTVAEAGDISYTLPVIRGGEVVSITVRNTEALSVVCKKGDGADTEKHIRLTRYTAAPVRCGDVLGEAIFTSGERVIGSVKLRAAEDVAAEERKHWFGR